jgi:hypothetical protein
VRDRFWVQPGDYCDPSEWEPQTMPDLLEVLHVVDEPEDVRAAAVREWLKTNTPTQMMEYCLVQAGFLDHVTYGV